VAEYKIPKITNERLNELVARIKPVVKNGKELHYIASCDLRNTAFTWDPVLGQTAGRLMKLRTVRTLHTYGYYGFFKPSVAEVLAQIPEDLVDKAIAFETIGPEDADALNKEKEALDAGFHVADTTFYGLDQTAPTVWDRLGA
jgi:hypothetical protein